jgi:hypothetical protein
VSLTHCVCTVAHADTEESGVKARSGVVHVCAHHKFLQGKGFFLMVEGGRIDHCGTCVVLEGVCVCATFIVMTLDTHRACQRPRVHDRRRGRL